LAILKLEEIKKPIYLPNRNKYGEINPKINGILLQTASLYLFNLPSILKSYITKEKSLAVLFNAEQIMATLKTTTNL